MLSEDCQLLPNEILSIVARLFVDTTSVRRTFKLRLVNAFLADEVIRLYFEEGRNIDAILIPPLWFRRAPTFCSSCYVYRRVHYGPVFFNTFPSEGWEITAPWLARYLASIVDSPQSQCPEALVELRASIIDGVRMYTALDGDHSLATSKSTHVEPGSNFTIQESAHVRALCTAAIRLLGAPVTWSLTTLISTRRIDCIPRFLQSSNPPANSAAIWACAKATNERNHHLIRLLLDSTRCMSHAELRGDLTKIEAIISRSKLWYFDKELNQISIMKWLDCVAACLQVAVRNADHETFTFLLDYDAATNIIGSALFRSCRFFSNRNVQELTILEGQSWMLSELMKRGWCGVKPETPRKLIERLISGRKNQS